MVIAPALYNLLAVDPNTAFWVTLLVTLLTALVGICVTLICGILHARKVAQQAAEDAKQAEAARQDAQSATRDAKAVAAALRDLTSGALAAMRAYSACCAAVALVDARLYAQAAKRLQAQEVFDDLEALKRNTRLKGIRGYTRVDDYIYGVGSTAEQLAQFDHDSDIAKVQVCRRQISSVARNLRGMARDCQKGMAEVT